MSEETQLPSRDVLFLGVVGASPAELTENFDRRHRRRSLEGNYACMMFDRSDPEFDEDFNSRGCARQITWNHSNLDDAALLHAADHYADLLRLVEVCKVLFTVDYRYITLLKTALGNRGLLDKIPYEMQILMRKE